MPVIRVTAIRMGYQLPLQFHCARHRGKHFTRGPLYALQLSFLTKNRSSERFSNLPKLTEPGVSDLVYVFPAVVDGVSQLEVQSKGLKTRTSNPNCYPPP